jgi:hypothetical protein
VRNSSPAERVGAEDVTGLKLGAEARGQDVLRHILAVGGRSKSVEARPKGRVEGLEVRMPA